MTVWLDLPVGLAVLFAARFVWWSVGRFTAPDPGADPVVMWAIAVFFVVEIAFATGALVLR